MEVSRLSSLSIKSSIRNYEVFFSKSIFEPLKHELKSDDIIIMDKNVYAYLNEDIQPLITTNNHILIDATENQKSYTALTPIIEELIESGFRKNNRLIAIGGGITQDITAFISSIMYRGVEWLFFPTTLLAQADSCIGGKTSINIGDYKNQLGNFYPPQKIFIIPEFVKTLPELDFKSGMGEMLHFYLVSGENDFNFYRASYENAFANDKVLLKLIRRNLEIKKGFIERDEFDRGERLLLNYGHSFGHAIESMTDYSVPHGIAVSYGMDIANFVSVKMGFLKENVYNDIHRQLEKIWEGTSLGEIDVAKYETALLRDKKNIGGRYQLILSRGIGQMFMHGIEPNESFTRWLKEYFRDISS